MNSTKSTWQESFLIHSHEVDLNGTAHPHFLMSYMLDSAYSHVIGSQFSYEALLNEGRLWVLSRFFCMFHKFPKWKDEVIVETWGKGIDTLFGLRDFVMFSPSGEKYVSATSAWLLINRENSRPQRLDKLKDNFPFQLDRYELNIKLKKLAPLTSGEKKAEYLVNYTDIDVNRHVSSSKYMQWILNSFPSEFLRENILNSFEINYLDETKLNEKVIIVTEKSEEFYVSEILRESDNKVLSRAKLKYKKAG